MENEKLLPAEISQTEKSVVIYRSNDGTIQLEVLMLKIPTYCEKYMK